MAKLASFWVSRSCRWDRDRGVGSDGSETSSGFDNMNSLVARLLTDLTASMRFAGDLNVDLNEITTNLVPFPRMHYLLSSVSPMPARSATGALERRRIPPARTGFEARPRRLARMFSEAFSSSNMLMQADPRLVTAVGFSGTVVPALKTLFLSQLPALRTQKYQKHGAPQM